MRDPLPPYAPNKKLSDKEAKAKISEEIQKIDAAFDRLTYHISFLASFGEQRPMEDQVDAAYTAFIAFKSFAERAMVKKPTQ